MLWVNYTCATQSPIATWMAIGCPGALLTDRRWRQLGTRERAGGMGYRALPVARHSALPAAGHGCVVPCCGALLHSTTYHAANTSFPPHHLSLPAACFQEVQCGVPPDHSRQGTGGGRRERSGCSVSHGHTAVHPALLHHAPDCLCPRRRHGVEWQEVVVVVEHMGPHVGVARGVTCPPLALPFYAPGQSMGL